LFSVVGDGSTADRHWKNGVIHQPDACEPALSTLNPCPAVTGLGKSPSATGIGTNGASPFTIYAWIDCGPVAQAPAEADRRVRAALDRGAPRAVELVFWTGSVSTTGAPEISPHLAADSEVLDVGDRATVQLAASPVTTGSTTVDVVEAIGLLEEGLGDCYGGVGVIHVPRTALAHLAAEGLIERDGSQLKTIGGNLIAAGAGYPGTGPSGADPAVGHEWFYATGAVDMYEGNIVMTSSYAEAVDRANNSLVLIAERTYVLTWDCCLFAANVRLGGSDTGTVLSPD
jgi:hypothetical protein